MTEAIAYIPFDTFLAAEAQSPVRHDWVTGRVYAMAGGTERHDLVAQGLFTRLDAGAQPKRCRGFVGNRLLRASANAAYYPDVMIVCGRAPDEQYETDPSLLIEVLSPSTETVDRREKSDSYERIRSVHTYAIVHPTFRRFEIATRGDDGHWSWTALGSGDIWFTEYGDIELDAFYDAVDARSST